MGGITELARHCVYPPLLGLAARLAGFSFCSDAVPRVCHRWQTVYFLSRCAGSASKYGSIVTLYVCLRAFKALTSNEHLYFLHYRSEDAISRKPHPPHPTLTRSPDACTCTHGQPSNQNWSFMPPGFKSPVIRHIRGLSVAVIFWYSSSNERWQRENESWTTATPIVPQSILTTTSIHRWNGTFTPCRSTMSASTLTIFVPVSTTTITVASLSTLLSQPARRARRNPSGTLTPTR